MQLAGVLEAAVTFLYPDVCQVCGRERVGRKEGYVCAACRRGIRYLLPPKCDRCGLPFAGDIGGRFECANCREVELYFSSARAAVAATGVVLDVVHQWKYSRALWFEPFLAGLLLQEASPALRAEGWDLLVPVPLHPLKQAVREFNQAERLARRLSRHTAIPLGRDLVRRVAATDTQTKLTRRERAENMRGAFRPGGAIAQARGRQIVLVDDILTTGATASACARVLRRAGAVDVCVWTVARGLLH